ncbi:MAG: hypothetical protein HZC43_05785 [Nitrosomonadales bacterium]|nr:hypothetical protein [Nitrosomonadales bacterium]
MGEPAGRRIPGVALILLASMGVAVQRVAYAAEIAIEPVRPVAEAGERPIVLAALTQTIGGEAAMQETRGADASVGPQAAAQEARSVTRQPSRNQRRRKPRMAGVPAGSPVAAPEAAEPPVKTVARETGKVEPAAKPRAGEGLKVEEEDADPFAPSKPRTTAQKDEEPDPFAASRPGAAATETKPAPESKPPAKRGKKYAMAPIRWAARVSETLGLLREKRTETSINGSTYSSILNRKRNFTNIQTAEIKAASYIMQPYIAQVNGGLGVLSSKENIYTINSTNGVPGTVTRTANRDNKLFGNGGLALFARSRFPFTASFSTTDSRAGQELGGEETSIKTLSLQQSYRPPVGPSRYSLGYQLNSTDAKRSGKYSYTAWNGTYSTKLGSEQDQPLYSSARRTVSKSRLGDTLTTNILSAQHTYLPPDSLLLLKSSANFTQSMQGDQAQQGSSRARFMQLNTVASWQPEDEEVPLFLTGTGRYFRAVTVSQGSEVTTTNIGGTGSAFYDASDNLKYNADASVTRSVGRGTGEFITTQNGTATYRSDNIKLENKASYVWTANGGLTNQTGGPGVVGGSGFNPRAFTGIGHALSGYLDFAATGKVVPRYTLSQDVSVNLPLSDNAARISEKSSTFRNSAGLSSTLGGERMSGSASATVTDVKVTGGTNAGRTRTVAVYIGGQGQQPIYEGYGAKVDGTMQVTRAPDGRMQTSGALAGTYAKNHVFGVRNLRYRGQLDITAQSNTATANAANGGTVRKPLAYALDQHLSYRIGMNEARLTAFLDDKNGVKHASLFLQLRAWRTIGN